MEKENLVAFINQVIPVGLQKANEIAGHFKPLQIERGQYFIKEGTVTNQYLFLESGFIRAFLLDTQGNEVTTEFYSKHEVVFEVSSFFRKMPSKENFQALEDCQGWCINYDEL